MPELAAELVAPALVPELAPVELPPELALELWPAADEPLEEGVGPGWQATGTPTRSASENSFLKQRRLDLIVHPSHPLLGAYQAGT